MMLLGKVNGESVEESVRVATVGAEHGTVGTGILSDNDVGACMHGSRI
jgi:hypothetical protein